ncbi:hypothetical protein GCM10027565_03490 [Bordetella tumulicola]
MGTDKYFAHDGAPDKLASLYDCSEHTASAPGRADNATQAHQCVILVPNTAKNCASHAGWAGQAGAVTRLPSVCA